MKKISLSLVFIIVFAFSCIAVLHAEQQAPEVKWTQGPANVSVGDIASVELSSDYLFAGKADTNSLMEYFGNTADENTIGSIFSQNEDENWFILFEYNEVGHIKDSEKDTINADELLQSYKEGTAEGNKERRKNGISEMTIKGWIQAPKYDNELHSLVWCILGESSDGKTANYEARLLCREGYVSATLVCADSELEVGKPHFYNIINKFSFNQGKRYEDYVQGKDKLSDLGLTALVVGGTAVAVKKGLLVVLLAFLKKGGIVLLLPVIAFLKKLFNRKKHGTYDNGTPDTAAETPSETLTDTSSVETSAESEEKPVVWIGLNEIQDNKLNDNISKDGDITA